ncbi:MAG: GTPase HflX [Phycisphaerae bacterium]
MHEQHEQPKILTKQQFLGKLSKGLDVRDKADASTEDLERATLVSVLLPDTTADLNDPLGELKSLAESAGTVVVDSMVQKRTGLTPSHALGKGKLEELRARLEDGQADVVIFDNQLSTRQIRGLEKALNVKVIDRSELILDIFAARATTREAQLQVELAQLEYTAPRLRGLWTHLERIAGAGGGTAAGKVGGVGTRGPGERQIEIDRRIVKDRISYLKREIEKIDQRKQREVNSRSDQFTVAMVGYTNSGKTTLLNRMTDTTRYAADQLFATLDTKTARWDLGEGRSVLLSDTVGFVRDIPPGLVASFRATLEETIHADLLLHVVDASSSRSWHQMQTVDGVLKTLGCEQIPQITVLNKMDKADDTSTVELLARYRGKTIEVSALTGDGLDDLVAAVTRRMTADSLEVTVIIPHEEGKLRSDLARLADVLDTRYVKDGTEMDICMSRAPFMQLRRRYPSMRIIRGNVDALEPEEF